MTGKRETRFHTFKGTKREAQAELTRLTAEAQRGTYVEATAETVGAFMGRWARDWGAANVSPKTIERYDQIIRNQIHPHIGNRALQKLRPVDLNELYGTLLRDGLAPRTVGHVHRLLHRALGHAVTWNSSRRRRRSQYARAACLMRRSISFARTISRPSYKSSTVSHCIRSRCLRWRPACGAANYWPCAGRMSISMPA